MKKLLLLTIRETLREIYHSELELIFSGYLEIHSLSLEKQLSDLDFQLFSKCDILVTSNNSLFNTHRQYLNPDCRVIHLEYTFLKEHFKMLDGLTSGTSALVCFNYYSVAHYISKMIFNMGIQNLNLSIYEGTENELLADPEKYDFLIVDETTTKRPSNVANVVNLGVRRLTYSTLLDIANASGSFDATIEERISNRCSDIAIPNNFLDEMYLYSNSFKFQLRVIMDNIDHGILIINQDRKIINHNTTLLELFRIKSNILDRNIEEIRPLYPILPFMDVIGEVRNEPILIHSKHLMVTIKNIIKRPFPDKLTIILFKDITDLLNMQKNLSHHIEQHGHKARYQFGDIKGPSKAITECKQKALRMANIDRPVFIQGESGTGKELFAQSIHNESHRAKYPFVAINVAALPSTLLESELFGYDEGTFTGGKKGGKAGLFEQANHGTIFLDEIGDMPMETQVKLLRVLEEREIMKLGGDKLIKVDVRVIAATNKNIEKLIQADKFRLDLYYRLNTIMLKIPPLRERKEDIRYLIDQFVENTGSNIHFSDKALEYLLNHPWNGNARELKNCMDYLTELYSGLIQVEDLPPFLTMNQSILNTEKMHCDTPALDQKVLKLIRSGIRGRRTIHDTLRKNGENLSEYQLRELLTDLEARHYILIQRGRSGIHLTEKGHQLLESKD